ncbi:MAG: hypothetical protein IH951_11830 [Bacteroidetes bacterium]|nr:hypothetical protein [Bacteroidota bacterium]
MGNEATKSKALERFTQVGSPGAPPPEKGPDGTPAPPDTDPNRGTPASEVIPAATTPPAPATPPVVTPPAPATPPVPDPAPPVPAATPPDPASVAPPAAAPETPTAPVEIPIPTGLIPGVTDQTPPAAAPAVAPVEISEPEGLNDGQKDSFAKSRIRIKSLEQELTAVRAGAPASDTELVTKLQGENTQLRDTLGRVSLEKHPEFVAKFDDPIAVNVDQIKLYLKEYDADESQADVMIGMGLKARTEHLREHFPDLLSILPTLFNAIDQLNTQRGVELEAHADNSKVYSQQAAVQHTQANEVLFSESLKMVRDAGQFLLKPVDGNEPWNRQTQMFSDAAKGILMGNDIEAQARTIIMGTTAPTLVKLLAQAHTKINELQAKHDKLVGVTPAIGATEETGKPPANDGKLKPVAPSTIGATVRAAREARENN